MDDELINDIIVEIKNENCILILGPDIIDFGKKTFFETMCDTLLNNDQYKDIIDASPQYVFINEELLQLRSKKKEMSVLRAMERFYQNQTKFEEPLTKISQIPFNIIISLLPDDRLQKIFTEQKFDFDFSYYPTGAPPKAVEKPSQNKPLIYNLLGDFFHNDAVITFNHLFSFLSGILGKYELPSRLQESLKKARTFLFLGVHFEKWYVQLLLRVLTQNEEKDKYTILKNTNNDEVYTFIARRLDLDFLPKDPLLFLDDLYARCQRQSILKKQFTKSKKMLFISYCHHDKEIVTRIYKSLVDSGFDVIIDENSMAGGEKIIDFLETIQSVDLVISIISENSLLSPWVSKEIITTVEKTNKLMLPCLLEKLNFDDDFYKKADQVVNIEIAKIDEMIKSRGKGSISDLVTKREMWSDYSGNLPKVLNEIRTRKCISLVETEFEDSLKTVIIHVTKLLSINAQS